jgi:hypothetical protein
MSAAAVGAAAQVSVVRAVGDQARRQARLAAGEADATSTSEKPYNERIV